MGSIFEARIAGSNPAPRATRTSATAAPPNTSGSDASISKSRDFATRPTAKAITIPTLPPTKAMTPTCRNTIPRTVEPSAPSAMRNPNSRVRCATV